MVIACPRGEATEILESTGSGFVVPPEDVDALVVCIGKLSADRMLLGKLARASADSAEKFERTRQARLMMQSLASAKSD